MNRMAKKRALQRAGFVHVEGWVRKADAPRIESKIAEAKPEAEEALKHQADETLDAPP